MTRARDLASLGDNTSKLEQQGMVQVIASSVAKGASGSASVDSKGNVTFSGTESIALNGVFSNTYQNYKVIVNPTGTSTQGNLQLRFRANGTDTSGGNYWNTFQGINQSNTAINEFGVNQNQIRLGEISSSAYNYQTFTFEVYDPYTASYQTKMWNSSIQMDGSSILGSKTGGGGINTTTQFDGFSLSSSTGGATISGIVRVYGYNQ
jgi:hypothetical protein